MATYFTLLTPAGLAKVANAQLTNEKIEITQVAVGDANGTPYQPAGTETALRREVWRGGIASIEIDSQNQNWIVVEAVIPASAGGFTIREVGLFDTDGTMIAIGNYPDTYKPVIGDGSTMDLSLRTIIEVNNASSVTLRVDPNVIVASRAYVDSRVSNALGNIGQDLATLTGEVDAHIANTNNPHAVTAQQIGAVRRTGDTMTGDLTTTGIRLSNGASFRETLGVRTLINAHSDRLDVISQDGTKVLFRWQSGDFLAYDENGVLIDSIKSLKQRLGVQDSGTWTPVLRGATTAGTPVYTRRVGEWIRHNNLMYIRGEILLSNKSTMAGALEITGFPLPARGSYRVATMGVHNQLTYPENARSMSGYIDTSVLRPYFDISGTGSELIRINASDIGNTFLVTFNAIYDI